MFKIFTGFVAGVIAGYVLGLVLPIRFFLATCLVLLVLAILLFFLFHLGLCDFQEY